MFKVYAQCRKLNKANVMAVRREAKFSIKFRHWLRANPIPFSCTFEMKDTRGRKSFPFAELKEEQIDWGMAIQSKKGVFMRNQGGGGEPDYTYHYNEPSFVVINFNEGFAIIEIAIFVLERDTSKKKSLTWERASVIARFKELYSR